MNSRERVLSCLRREGYDRIPVKHEGTPEVNRMILDHYGAPVWYKRTPGSMIDAKKLSDGRLAFTPSFGAYGIFQNQGYWLTNLQGAGTIKHRTTNPAPDQLPTDHHDYIELPGGSNRRALISYPIVGGVDLSTMPGGQGTVQEDTEIVVTHKSGAAANR